MPLRTLSDKKYEDRHLAGVRLGYDNEDTTPAIAYQELDLNQIAFAPDNQERITQGLSGQAKYTRKKSETLTMDFQYYQAVINEISRAKTGTTFTDTGTVPSDFYEIELTYHMVDTDDGTAYKEVVRYLKCNVSRRDAQSATADQIAADQVVFEAKRATTDLLGDAVTGLATEGGFSITSAPVAL
jgi:hypothetical protein